VIWSAILQVTGIVPVLAYLLIGRGALEMLMVGSLLRVTFIVREFVIGDARSRTIIQKANQTCAGCNVNPH